jgi:hypothetical protein
MFRDIVWEDISKWSNPLGGPEKSDTYGIVDVFDGIRYMCMNLKNFVPLDSEDEKTRVIHDPLSQHPGYADEMDEDAPKARQVRGWGWKRGVN